MALALQGHSVAPGGAVSRRAGLLASGTAAL